MVIADRFETIIRGAASRRPQSSGQSTSRPGLPKGRQVPPSEESS
jgi:hypothetical protein